MANNSASRKWQITINNPKEKGYNHETLKALIDEYFTNNIYGCMCDETGEEGTYHTHIYLVFTSAVMFSTMKNRFPEAHFENAKGKNIENKNYIRKEGKWEEDKKKETNHIETFEEWGEIPPDRQGSSSISEDILDFIKEGKSDKEILEAYPSTINRLDKIERARQTLLEDKYREEFRNVKVTYIYGKTGIGKTRGVMDKYGYRNVYRITDYEHPSDGYKGENVIVFEEFRSDIKISQMLNYLDGYPCQLPCRYANKTACYHYVYLTTNLRLEEQYPNIQTESPRTWEAFLRRINCVEEKKEETEKNIMLEKIGNISDFEEITFNDNIFEKGE